MNISILGKEAGNDIKSWGFTFVPVFGWVGRCARYGETRGGEEGPKCGFHVCFALLTSCGWHSRLVLWIFEVTVLISRDVLKK